MVKTNGDQFKYLLLSSGLPPNHRKDISELASFIDEVIREIDGKSNSESVLQYASLQEHYFNIDKLIEADFIFVVLNYSREIAYEIGLINALAKPAIYIVHDKKTTDALNSLASAYALKPSVLSYSLTPSGIDLFRENLSNQIFTYRRSPQNFIQYFSLIPNKTAASPVIDLDKLNPQDYENLCFELLSQMGFKKLKWSFEWKDISIVAALPKKDPDGFIYDELWLVFTSERGLKSTTIDSIIQSSEYVINRLNDDFFKQNKIHVRFEIPVTMLFMLKESGDSYVRFLEQVEGYNRPNRMHSKLRTRVWDNNTLTRLIQGFPQIANKYFSSEARLNANYRKSPEILYDENILLTEKLLESNNQLNEEKRKRFIAERETAWKDVAFKAAHKLGNNVDAADTFLQSLKRRLRDSEYIKAEEIAERIDESIEKAKTVIGQFKSLDRVDEINVESVDIIKVIRDACKSGEERGIIVNIISEEALHEALIDPYKIEECFSELFANSLRWFNKSEKLITVNISKVNEIPEPLNQQEEFLEIVFADNGCGIKPENKEKIFSPFVTTDPHGSGLGLSLVKKIIEKHGGWIIENGKFGVGASFVIHLPIAKDN